ncbi:phage tail protein [Microbacterium terricola]|uniref:Phage tail protein n=1 Tax=Microbacterium terricola TaxID=344163 RepID=A0ABM8E145_9MICO|nr:phage tail protein [Microbacterium terricola]UYK40724.1 phage tail protein [Microbacterium terricola]BDV31539.1 hypothetical protein Microterr_21990 [Microbacterium terricola]
MSAFAWLARADWEAAQVTDVVVEGGCLRLASTAGGGFARRGVAIVAAGAPVSAQRDSTTADRWRQLSVRLAEPAPSSAWVRVWTRVDPVDDPQPVPPAPEPDAAAAEDSPPDTAPATWRPAPVDALDVRVLCRDDGTLWICVELGGEGTTTPRVADIRVETGDDGPVTLLPVVYRATASDASTDVAGSVDSGDELLGRYLGLLGAQLRSTSSLLDELPALLSPDVAPDRADSPWIERLAEWVALEPEQLTARTDPARRREDVALAVSRHARRGTRDGLRDEISRRTGVATALIEIEEPLLEAEIWRLDGAPDTSALGVTTGLLVADPGPPALDRTAILDASMLIDDDEAGLPVHAAIAHRLCVHVVGGTPAQVAAVDAVVQRERPAHVLARTCAVARTTGMSTMVGIDALPGPGPRGLANDIAHHPSIDGPGVRIGTARLPGEPQNPRTHAHEGEAP